MTTSDYPTCKRTFATFRVYPEPLAPSDVTARLGLAPTRWQVRGQPERPGARPARMHGWFLRSEGAVDSQDVRKHLDWLLSLLLPRADALLDLRSDGCTMDVFCYWLSAHGHGGPLVDPSQLRALASLNLALGFDVYGARS